MFNENSKTKTKTKKSGSLGENINYGNKENSSGNKSVSTRNLSGFDDYYEYLNELKSSGNLKLFNKTLKECLELFRKDGFVKKRKEYLELWLHLKDSQVFEYLIKNEIGTKFSILYMKYAELIKNENTEKAQKIIENGLCVVEDEELQEYYTRFLQWKTNEDSIDADHGSAAVSQGNNNPNIVNNSISCGLKNKNGIFEVPLKKEENVFWYRPEDDETISSKVFKKKMQPVQVFRDDDFSFMDDIKPDPIDPFNDRARILNGLNIVKRDQKSPFPASTVKLGDSVLRKEKEITDSILVYTGNKAKAYKLNSSLWEYYIYTRLNENVAVHVFFNQTVLEMPLGDQSLIDFLMNTETTEEQRLQIVHRVIELTLSLHQKQIVHNDLCLSNFVFFANNLKLIDYSSSIDLKLYSADQYFKIPATNNDDDCDEIKNGLEFRMEQEYFKLGECLYQIYFLEDMKMKRDLPVKKYKIINKVGKVVELVEQLLNMESCEDNLKMFIRR